MNRRAHRVAPVLLALLTALTVLAGCATVPGSSDVTVLRRIGDDGEPSPVPGPARGAGPLQTVRGWVLASGASADRHEAARAFLTTPAAASWDDGGAVTVVADRVDTVFAGRAVPPGRTAVRVRAKRLGTLTASGAFVAQSGQLDLVVELTRQNGQWRIAALPPGTIVRHGDLRANTDPVRAWFLGARRPVPVGDLRYLATGRARAPARALQLLLAGPSEALSGAAVSALPPGATLRSPVGTGPGGAAVVDLSGLGGLDGPRRGQIAQQVVLTLAEVGLPRVRLLVDGRPLLPNRPEITVADVLAGLPLAVRLRADLPADPTRGPVPPSRIPALVVTGGAVRVLGGEPTAGPAGTGTYGALAADPAPDGQSLAVVASEGDEGGGPAGRGPGPVRLLAGRVGAELTPTGIAGATLTRPSWSPSGAELWTVVDGARVARAVRDPVSGRLEGAPVDATALTGALRGGPLTALRLSPDGARVAAVGGGRVAVGAVVRDGAGGARIGSVRVLRPEALRSVLDVAWSRTDRLVAVGAGAVASPVAFVSVDGLELDPVPPTNLTPPVTAVAAAPGRPVIATDQVGMWTLPSDGPAGVWRSVPGVPPGARPAYQG